MKRGRREYARGSGKAGLVIIDTVRVRQATMVVMVWHGGRGGGDGDDEGKRAHVGRSGRRERTRGPVAESRTESTARELDGIRLATTRDGLF